MTRNNPRRPSSSRTPVSRPRRVAGQGSAPVESGETPVESGLPPVESGVAPVEPTELVEPPPEKHELDPAPEVVPDRPGVAALFDSRRATVVLVVLAAVLAVAAGGLFAWDGLRDDDKAPAAVKFPVLVTQDAATEGVAAAAEAAETIVGTSYEDYDKQIDEAAALMTDDFAKEYRQTAEDARADVVDAKAVIDARVVAQGVVEATRTEVKALVFLNQYVSKDGGDTTYTPYRALVTVVNTDKGWLVADLDTK